jgi:kynureninase
MTDLLTQTQAQALDAQDPIRSARDLFDLPAGVIYLDGNSLGARPKSAMSAANHLLVEQWGKGLIGSWNGGADYESWFTLPQRLGNQLAPLIGAKAGEVLVVDTISVNLFKLLACALQIQSKAAPTHRVVVSEASNFPTDLYMMQGMNHWLESVGVAPYELRLIHAASELPAALKDDVALVMLTHVNYRTGAMFDMSAITAQIHACGALALWDLAHSAGAVPIDLNASGADFAVGCTYKYLNGGPGSPAFVWAKPSHVAGAAIHQPLTGWWGHSTPFAMSHQYVPKAGIEQFNCGTQPIMSMALVACGLEIHNQVGMAALRAKSIDLVAFFIAQAEARCAGLGITLASPRDAAQRGSQASFTHENAYAVMQALIARGVVGDFRAPDIIRFGFAPLYIGFEDVWRSVEVLYDILSQETWKEPQFSARKGAVT